MNLNWMSLSDAQRSAVSFLCQRGLCPLPREVAEKLINLGIAEQVDEGAYCISAFGTTVAPTSSH